VGEAVPFTRVEVAPGWRGTQPREWKRSPHEWEMQWSAHEWELCGGGGAHGRGIGSGHRTSTSCAEAVGHTAAGEAVAIAREEGVWRRWGTQPREK